MSTTQISPTMQAALTILSLRTLKRLNFSAPMAKDVFTALGVKQASAYELAKHIEDNIHQLERPIGRPPIAPVSLATDETAFNITCRVRDFLMDNPGAVVVGESNWYSDAFRLFVLEMLAPGGIAHGMRVVVAALAIGIPQHTLRQWLGPTRPSPPAEAKPGITQGEHPQISAAIIAQILHFWEHWSGSLMGFRSALREQHRIDLSINLLRSLLELTGHRHTKRRKKKE